LNGASPAGGAWGLSLLMRQGLAAWMHAWPQQSGHDPPVSRPSLPSIASSALSPSLSGQLVTVLANMVFTAQQEVLA
jgi:hypothetical protein